MQSVDRPDTRARLLQAAAQLMWERSFQATGVDDLCAKAEANKGSFYHFFPSKTDLAVAAIEESWAHTKTGIFEPTFDSGESGLGQLRDLAEKVYQVQLDVAGQTGSFMGCPFGNLGQEMARQDERIRETLQKIFDGHCAFIETALVRAVRAGEIPDGNNRQRARNIFALLEGALLLAKVANDPQVFRGIEAAIPVVAAA